MKSAPYWLLIFLILGGSALRFFRLDYQELRGDEAFSWNYAVNKSGPWHIVETIITEGDPQPPLHYWLLQGWTRVFGDNEWALRSSSATLSILLIPLIFAVGKRWFNARVGLIAAGITTLHPYQIWLAQDVRNMYILATGFSLLSIHALLRLNKTGNRIWWQYVVFSLLGLFSHYYSGFGLASHLILIALSWDNHARRRAWLSANLLITALLAPWLAIILPVFLGGQLADPTRISLLDYFNNALLKFMSGPSIGLLAGLGILIVWATLSVWGMKRAEKTARNRLAMLLGWFGITLAAVYAVTFARATLNSFYLMVAFPAVYLLAAYGISKLNTALLRTTLLGAICVVFGLTLYNHYVIDAYSKTQGLRDLSDRIEAQRTPNDIVITNIPDPVQVYYLRNTGIPRSLLPQRDVFTEEHVTTAIDNLQPYFENVWVIPARAAKWDADGLVETTFNDRYLRNGDYNFATARLQRFAMDPATDPDFISLDLDLADGIRLVGAYIALNGDATIETASDEQWVRTTLVWEAIQPPTQDYQVFVHARAFDGFVVAQHDGIPHNAQAPTSTWVSGNTVLDVHEFQLPAGLSTPTIDIVIGMYDPATGERLQTANSQTDQVFLRQYQLAIETP